MDCLHRAVTLAVESGDRELHARSLVALGGALVHAMRGRDDEGAVVLHEACRVAGEAGEDISRMTAYRELGFVEVQAGRRATATAWLDRASALARTDEARAAVLGVQAMNASDVADYPGALAAALCSSELAARCGDARQQAWSLAVLARAYLLRGELAEAAAALSRSLALSEEQRWLAFQPWPIALKAELDLLSGDQRTVGDDLERAWALSCQLGDPCWEGLTARALGLMHVHRNELTTAGRWLDEALRRCSAASDRYQWVRGYVLDARVSLALLRGHRAEAVQLVDTLASLAARCELRELVVRAQLHRYQLGDDSALPAARLLARDIDNPALARELADAGGVSPAREL
jgi:tetratricopeptide (TPR) repeat protein